MTPTLQQPVLDYADIPGQWNVKRAIEVAASGGHSLLLFGPPDAYMDDLRGNCIQLNTDCRVVALAALPCDADTYDLVVYCDPPRPREILHHRSSENLADVSERLARVAAWADTTDRSTAIDAPSHSIIELAVRKLELTPPQVESACRVARTIADLAWSVAIRPEHVAEALQYKSYQAWMEAP